MRKAFYTLLLICFSGLGLGQTHKHRNIVENRNQLNIGVGLSEWGIPVYVGMDRRIDRDISAGGELSYRNYDEHIQNLNYNHNILGIAANLNYHFNNLLHIPDLWDFYVGPNLGLFIWSSPSGYSGPHNTGLRLGAQIGLRYYISQKVGLNLEFGGGNAFTNGKFGISIKI